MNNPHPINNTTERLPLYHALIKSIRKYWAVSVLALCIGTPPLVVYQSYKKHIIHVIERIAEAQKQGFYDLVRNVDDLESGVDDLEAEVYDIKEEVDGLKEAVDDLERVLDDRIRDMEEIRQIEKNPQNLGPSKIGTEPSIDYIN